MKGISESCPTKNPPPPKRFRCISPRTLEDSVSKSDVRGDDLTTPPPEPDWPLLIPEVSDISATTSRLGVRPGEGEWSIDKWDPIAWDMTGYLFDKVHGAHWVREPDGHQVEDWHRILGPSRNWIQNLVMVDRLPDRLAMQTPPSSIVVAYLNRLYACQPGLLVDKDAPRLWLMTHGYPSYIDWPPAWHWNLGVRMLCSLASYVGSQSFDEMGAPEGAWYPERDRQTVFPLRLPYVALDGEDRLLFRPGPLSYSSTEMDWTSFPGIIPFIPGADTKQLSWFTKQVVKLGYSTVALDAMNTIAHETFIGLQEAVSAVIGAGAHHVFIYGPWPLHPPTDRLPTHHVSYVPCAAHMDLTDYPRRFWRKKPETEIREDREWRRLPSYRRAYLDKAAVRDDIEICACPACRAARGRETDPRSVWRWGHMLRAGAKWQKAFKKKVTPQDEEGSTKTNIRLRYQGPSYTVFRKCLHYPLQVQRSSTEGIIESVVFTETQMVVRFADGTTAPSIDIRWSLWERNPVWAADFPCLEE